MEDFFQSINCSPAAGKKKKKKFLMITSNEIISRVGYGWFRQNYLILSCNNECTISYVTVTFCLFVFLY